jgi:hypothetical protein
MPRPLVISVAALRRELSGPEMSEFLDAFGDETERDDEDMFQDTVNDALAEIIRDAQDDFEAQTNVFLTQRRIVTHPAPTGWKLGREYDMEDDPYDLDTSDWRGNGTIKLRWRPVVGIDKVEFRFGNSRQSQIRQFSPSWISRRARLGLVHVMAFYGTQDTNSTTTAGILPHWQTSAGLSLSGSMGGHLPSMVAVDYTSGLLPRDFNALTTDPNDACPNWPVRAVLDIVKMMAAHKALRGLQDALGAGGGSVGMDGLSESFSENRFGARIQGYETRIEKKMPMVLSKLSLTPMFSK